MRVLVLNGVNLNVLGRRDPKLYGGLTIAELESRIYEWARELELTVQCRQTNDEGEFVKWCHDAYDTVDGDHRQPRRVDALRVGDPRRARAAHDPDRRGAPLQRRRAGGVAAHSVVSDLVAARFVGHGPDGYRMALDYLKENAA